MSEADRIVAAIRTWEPAEQKWWRELLELAPQEALLVGRLAVELDARPQTGGETPGTRPSHYSCGHETDH